MQHLTTFYSYRINLTKTLLALNDVSFETCVPPEESLSMMVIYLFYVWPSASHQLASARDERVLFKLRICMGFLNLMANSKSKA